jgi:hypothetical protein
MGIIRQSERLRYAARVKTMRVNSGRGSREKRAVMREKGYCIDKCGARGGAVR